MTIGCLLCVLSFADEEFCCLKNISLGMVCAGVGNTKLVRGVISYTSDTSWSEDRSDPRVRQR